MRDQQQLQNANVENSIRITIPWQTYLQAILVGGLLLSFSVLWSLILLIALALVISCTLFRARDFLVRRGFSQGRGATCVVVGVVCILIAMVALLVPAIIEQGRTLAAHLPETKDKLLASLQHSSFLNRGATELSNLLTKNPGETVGTLSSVGTAFVDAALHVALLFIISFYILVDGEKVLGWALAFASPNNKRKVLETIKETSAVVAAYVSGQAITSGLVFAFSMVTLSLLKVPGAVVLATIASILDVVPVIGFAAAIVPAVLAALTVSTTAALAVGSCYIVYHLCENYVIIPRLYGRTLRVSTFTVLISLLIGWELGGVMGALLALPLVASYSHIEKIWLVPYVTQPVVDSHEAQKRDEFGDAERT